MKFLNFIQFNNKLFYIFKSLQKSLCYLNLTLLYSYGKQGLSPISVHLLAEMNK